MNKLYVFGHTKPDTDSIASAIVFARLQKALGIDAVAYKLGEVNKETKYALKTFEVEEPQTLTSVDENCDVALVDNNEFSQSVSGIEKAHVKMVVDHHKIKLETVEPIYFITEPLGCTCTILYKLYKQNEVDIDSQTAGLMLSAIISDTLLFKSPTTTEMDKLACEELSKIANVDMESYAMEMFKAGTSLDEYSIEEIVNMDFKEFDMSGKRVGIGQVFTLDIDSIFAKKDEFLSHINSTDYDMLVLAITDIIKEGSYLIYKAEDKIIAEAFSVDASQGVFAEGVVSRKKQMLPKILENLD